MVRALASHQFDRGSILARCHLWVEFVVGSHLTLRGFLRVFQLISPLHKSDHSKFQLDEDRGPTWKPAKADVASYNVSKYFNLFIYWKSHSHLSAPCTKVLLAERDRVLWEVDTRGYPLIMHKPRLPFCLPCTS